VKIEYQGDITIVHESLLSMAMKMRILLRKNLKQKRFKYLWNTKEHRSQLEAGKAKEMTDLLKVFKQHWIFFKTGPIIKIIC